MLSIPTSLAAATDLAYSALDNGLIPDVVVRRAIAYLCEQRLKEISADTMEEAVEGKWKYIEALKMSEIAIEQAKANEQHYEVSRLELRTRARRETFRSRRLCSPRSAKVQGQQADT